METPTSQEIPKGEWAFFFDAFSRQHRGWIATTEVLDESVGDQIEGCALPFEGIFSNREAGRETISILLGREIDQHVSHTIQAPTRVVLEYDERAVTAGETLGIESEDGSKVLVRFHAAVRPEQLDGLA